MMHKKIFIAVFFLALLFPFASMLFYKTDMSVEKRHAQAFPELVEDGELNKDFFQELTDYMSDQFAFRQELATLDAKLKKGLFQVSNNEQVIVGTDGWLFFSETMDDYLKRNTMGEREVHNCAKTLALLQEGVEAQGANFVFTVAPNKNELYKEHMPSRLRPEKDVGNLDLLTKELEQQGVPYVDLRKALAKEEKELYHKLDTHWNNEGAAIACDSLLTSLGKEHYDYQEEPYQIVRNFPGDLQAMLMPKAKSLDENVAYHHEAMFSYVGEVESTADMGIETQCSQKEGSLLVFRDSFGNALLPFLADEYGLAYFTKEVPYNLDFLEEYGADDVILEIAQRNIPTLMDGIPYVMAPPREFDGEVDEAESTTSSLFVEEFEDCYLFYGELDASLLAADSDIYLCFNGEEACYMFEAFPAVCEYLEDTVERSACYGLYVAKDALEEENYKLELITNKNGTYYSTGIIGECEGGY